MTDTTTLTHLLEAESIHIMREVAAEADKPVMLYSIGKDSAVMLHLAKKAFYPSPPPFPLMHVDTTWKFQEMYKLREKAAQDAGMELIVHQNPEAEERGINPSTTARCTPTCGRPRGSSRRSTSTASMPPSAARAATRKRAARKSASSPSAPPRMAGTRKTSAPSCGSSTMRARNQGESIRVFPLSNWTELDIWQYIMAENIEIVPLYFSAKRPTYEHEGGLFMVDDDRCRLEKVMGQARDHRTLDPLPHARLLSR